MEITYIITMLVMSVAVSLGVGCSTVAIGQFFAAIRDGGIDQTERKMMGVVYLLLRVAMGAILLTLLVQAGIIYYITGNFLFISPFFLALYTAVAMLFINAIGMTTHFMPRQVGPALQAATWYTIGILTALVPLNLAGFTYVEFLLVYAGAVILAVAALNVTLKQLKPKTA